MKKLYTFFCLSLVCFGVICGCKTLLDVSPKEIYSPIELNKATIMVKYTVDVDSITNEIGKKMAITVENSNVEFKVKEDALYYGAVLFYDSLNAVELIKTNRFIGVHELYFQDQKKGSLGLNRTVKVRIDQTKGQNQYIVLVTYASDNSIIYNAQGLIRATISPWSHFTDIIPPTTSERVNLIRGADTLSYTKASGNAISCYKYNIKTAKFDVIGTVGSTQLSTTIAYGANVNTQSITPTDWVFYRKGIYYIVNRVSESKAPPVPTGYFAGRFGQTFLTIMALDKNFKSTGLSNGTSDLTTNGFSSGGDILAAGFYLDMLRIFYNTSTYSTANRSYMATYSTSTPGSALRDIQTSSNFLNPSLALTIDNKFIINNSANQNNLTIFNLSDNDVTKQTSKKLDNTDLFSFLNPVPNFKLGFFCVSADSQGYIIGKNQIIYQVKSDGTFRNIYTKWFPANGPASIIQVIMYKDKLAFLLNNYEVWLFDPNQIDIDFSRPSAINIVNL